MDIAWKSICENISLSGPHGITWDQFKNQLITVMNLSESQIKWPPSQALIYLLNIYAGLSPNYRIGKLKSNEKTKKDQKTKLMYFIDLDPIEMSIFLQPSTDPSTCRFYCSAPSLRHSHLFQGRPLQLSDSSLQTLEIIASYGRNGLTQAELARVLGCDSKNAFHWLKCLIANDLIARTPVASKKSFTYLLTLTRYLDEEISPAQTTQSQSTPAHTHTVVSSKEIRQNIINILSCAPNQTMVSKDVFALTGLDKLLIKNFRRAATKLNEIGWLEYLFEDQLVGPYCRLFRLKRKPAEGLDLKAFLAAQDEIKRLDNQESTNQLNLPRGLDFNPSHPIIHQIILLLSHAYPDPMTTGDLSHRLNITRKYLYKLIERIVPISGKKIGVLGAEGVGKVSEFVGKEKRLKLFIKSESFRDHYIKTLAPNISENTIMNPSRPTTPFSSHCNSQFSSHCNSQFNSSSTPLTQSPLSTTSSPSDTRTRQLRHQTLLQELSQKRVLEVGKELCQRLQTILGDSRFTLDVKTLRRSVDILEREGLLKVVIATIPSGTRTLLIDPKMDATAPFVQSYITKMNEFVRSGPLSASTQKLLKLKESMQNPDFFVEGSIPLGVPQTPSVNIKALINFGFIHGILARAQIFHYFLLENKDANGGVETIPTIFEGIPLEIYLKIVGIVRMSRQLFTNLSKYSKTRISELPDLFKEELTLNRKRFQSQISILLEILVQLKLIQGEEYFSSLNFKLPFKYNFALQVPLLNYRGEVRKIVGAMDFEEFWRGMRDISQEFHSRNISIHDSGDTNDDTIDLSQDNVPRPIVLARYVDSWKQKPSRERDLERVLRKLALQTRHTSPAPNNLFQSLASEYEVPLDKTLGIYEKFVRMLDERDEARRLDKLAIKRAREIDSDHDSESDESDSSDGLLEHLRWTPSDWTKLSLAFPLLLLPPFFSTSIKWHLATKIFDKPKSAIIIRRHGLKLFKSYRELKKIIEFDTIVALILKRFPDVSPSVDSFKTVFDACQSELTSPTIFDLFKEGSSGLESRESLYLDTIDSWLQTRSFRHGLLLNHPGHVHPRRQICTGDIVPDKDIFYLVRQVLVYSATSTDSFDYPATLSLLKPLSPDILSATINHLLATNFASKNKSRDKIRLFGGPLIISDTMKSIVEFEDDQDAEFDEIEVGNSTDFLTINKIDQFLQNHQKITELPYVESPKFDAPIKIKTSTPPPLNLSFISQSSTKTIWYAPTIQTFNQKIALNCLAHLQRTIKSRPGISLQDLKRRYAGLLLEFEIDILVDCLLKNKRIQLKHSQFLQ